MSGPPPRESKTTTELVEELELARSLVVACSHRSFAKHTTARRVHVRGGESMSAAQGVVYRCARAMSTRRVKLRLAGVSSAANENENARK